MKINKETWKKICPNCKEFMLKFKREYDYCQKTSEFIGLDINKWEICGFHYSENNKCENCLGKNGTIIKNKWYSQEIINIYIKGLQNISPSKWLIDFIKKGKPLPPQNRISPKEIKCVNNKIVTMGQFMFRFGVKIYF